MLLEYQFIIHTIYRYIYSRIPFLHNCIPYGCPIRVYTYPMHVYTIIQTHHTPLYTAT
ncbi:hypothetical protein HanIR_Chr12g0561961 [Helianthus annuus]|nr:hypothetical protein HanIR_Chr12g0561961 [Helianthus annuus]